MGCPLNVVMWKVSAAPPAPFVGLIIVPTFIMPWLALARPRNATAANKPSSTSRRMGYNPMTASRSAPPGTVAGIVKYSVPPAGIFIIDVVAVGLVPNSTQQSASQWTRTSCV